jgi:pyridoxal phosphate enzyme (YggS family)
LQRNKAKLVAARCDFVHTVDSLPLAEDLARRAGGRPLRCLVEVNLGDERQKGGVAPAEVERLCRELVQVASVSLVGLMCLPPVQGEPRGYFRTLRELRDKLEQRLSLALPELSMGMSADFEAAIEEGATWVRLGTAIFGARDG